MTKRKHSAAGGPSAAVARLMNRDAHRYTTQFWDEVIHICGSVEERAEALLTLYAAQRRKPAGLWGVKRHVLRALTLDLVCASFPEGHPPPRQIVQLLQVALG